MSIVREMRMTARQVSAPVVNEKHIIITTPAMASVAESVNHLTDAVASWAARL